MQEWCRFGRVVSLPLMIIMTRTFQFYYSWKNWMSFLSIFMYDVTEDVGLRLVNGWIRRNSSCVFLDSRMNTFATIPLLMKSGTNSWLCSLVRENVKEIIHPIWAQKKQCVFNHLLSMCLAIYCESEKWNMLINVVLWLINS